MFLGHAVEPRAMLVRFDIVEADQFAAQGCLKSWAEPREDALPKDLGDGPAEDFISRLAIEPAGGFVDEAEAERAVDDADECRRVVRDEPQFFLLFAQRRFGTRLLHGGPRALGDLSDQNIRRLDGPVWRLVNERPAHLLDPRYATWDAFLLDAVDRAIAALTQTGPLAARTWGEQNTADVTHPLASALPILGHWLNMPRQPLAGDIYAPRVASPRSGASERFVSSPGHDATAILHMPGGQSGHPLSAHYGDQQPSWVSGTPLPLRPGTAVHTLTLRP